MDAAPFQDHGKAVFMPLHMGHLTESAGSQLADRVSSFVVWHMQGSQEAQPHAAVQRSGLLILSALVVLLGLVGVAGGIAIWRRYQKQQQVCCSALLWMLCELSCVDPGKS